MKSNVCRIEKGTKDLDAILRESEKVAVYNDLTHKQSLQLRLLCEEIDGMLPEIIDDFAGDLWIEFEDGVCKVNVSIEFAEFSVEKKQELVALATNKKNAAATGVVGKIRSAVENLFLNEDTMHMYAMSSESFYAASGYTLNMDNSYLWSLEQYRNMVQKDKTQSEAWDELEKSVIASVADDVIIGVKGKRANIVIVKKFA